VLQKVVTTLTGDLTREHFGMTGFPLSSLAAGWPGALPRLGRSVRRWPMQKQGSVLLRQSMTPSVWSTRIARSVGCISVKGCSPSHPSPRTGPGTLPKLEDRVLARCRRSGFRSCLCPVGACRRGAAVARRAASMGRRARRCGPTI
jgi:hypothetical protein